MPNTLENGLMPIRNEEGEMESKRSLMRRIYIPEINAIVKRKGFGKLNDFEQLC